MSLANPWRRMPVHRIGTYTEHGLTPMLVQEFLKGASEVGCTYIVDPFIGSGVVAVEAQKLCINTIGIDANPWSLLITSAKTTPLNMNIVVDKVKNLLDNFDNFESLIPTKRLLKYYDYPILIQLGKLRNIIEHVNNKVKPILLASFMKIAYKHSNLYKTPAPRLRKNNKRKTQRDLKEKIKEEYLEIVHSNLKDLSQHEFCGDVLLILSDSSAWLPRKICGVLTSPPFANNIDYIRHTMLELLWSGFAEDSKDLGSLRNMQIPACEACSRSWKQELKDDELFKIVKKIKSSRAKGYRRYLLQYFSAMLNHFYLLIDRLEWQGWYTIGDSILGGVYIPTHEIIRRQIVNNYDKNVKIEIKEIGNRMRIGRKLYLLKIKRRS